MIKYRHIIVPKDSSHSWIHIEADWDNTKIPKGKLSVLRLSNLSSYIPIDVLHEESVNHKSTFNEMFKYLRGEYSALVSSGEQELRRESRRFLPKMQ